ncbi:MAG TPA: hypothetical protein VGL86_19165 [Polyangia bacterium]
MRNIIATLVLVCASVAHAQEAPPPATLPPPIVAPAPAFMQPAPPPPTRYEMKPNYALLFSGVGVLGLGYIMNVSGTLLVGHSPAWESAIPVIGPYFEVNDSFSKDWGDLGKAFYVFDGLTQTAGFVLTVVGVSLWHKAPVRSTQNGLAFAF